PSITRIGGSRGRTRTSGRSSARSSPRAIRAACSLQCGTISELPNRWPDCPLIPPGPRAALSALHLDDPRPEALARLSDEDWRGALTYTDRARLTLILRD